MCQIRAIACLVTLCTAEQVLFEQTPVPKAWGLVGWHYFSVYDSESYAASLGKSSFQVGPAKAEIQLVGVNTGNHSMATRYSSLEVSLVYQGDMLYFDRDHFCVKGRLNPGKADAEFKSFVIPIGDQAPTSLKTEVQLNQTGKYLLMLSNCATLTTAQVSGVVQVKNPYGYLPPAQYHAVTPLCIFLVLYILCACVYLAYGLQKTELLLETHLYFAGVFLFSIMEVAAKLWAYHTWNTTGADEPWMSVASILQMLKWQLLYALSTYIATGRCYSDSKLEEVGNKMWLLVFAASSLYMLLLTVRECTLMYGASQDPGPGLLFGASVPVFVMDAAMVMLLISQTHSQYEVAEASLNEERAAVFGKLHKLAVAVAVFGAFAVMVDLTHLFGVRTVSWQWQWLTQEGCGHALALFAMLVGSYVMRPGMLRRTDPDQPKHRGAAANLVGAPVDEEDEEEEM